MPRAGALGYRKQGSRYKVFVNVGGKHLHLGLVASMKKAVQLGRRAQRLKHTTLKGCSDSAKFRQKMGTEKKVPTGAVKHGRRYKVHVYSGAASHHVCCVQSEAKAKRLGRKAARLSQTILKGCSNPAEFRAARTLERLRQQGR